MNEINVPATTISRNFSAYLDRVVYNHEHFILTRGNKPIAKLEPLLSGKTLGDLALLLEHLPALTYDELEVMSDASDMSD